MNLILPYLDTKSLHIFIRLENLLDKNIPLFKFSNLDNKNDPGIKS